MTSKDSQQENEAALIIAVQQGNKNTFAAIYRTYFTNLCEFTYYITKDEEVAKELVQDTFLAVWDQRRTWSPYGTIRSYLYKAVKNRSLDFLKHQKVVRKWEKVSQFTEAKSAEDEDLLSQQQLANAIDNEVERLPQKCKMIFIMSRQQGLTYGEIAEIQQISIKTVETQIGRALKKLRSSLKDFL